MNGLLKDILKDPVVLLIIIIILAFCLSSCDKESLSEAGKIYTVQKGEHDFKPSPFPLPERARSLSGWAVLDSSCWYNSLGGDNLDWNKLCGIYKWGDYKKNRNSFILAWRPIQLVRNSFELCVYENIEGRNVPQESFTWFVKAGDTFRFEFVCNDGKYRLYVNDYILGTQQNGIQYTTVGRVSAWFGGNRTAPQKMTLKMNF